MTGQEPGPVERLSISPDRLRVVASASFSKIRRDTDWRPPLGIFLGMLVAAATVDFRSNQRKLGLTGAQWQVIVYVALAASLAWLVVSALRWQRFTLDDFVKEITVASDRSPVEERVVFFCRARDEKGHHTVLVFHDPIWECHFLPHLNSAPIDHVDELNDKYLIRWLADNLELEHGRFRVQYIEGGDLASVKYSEFHKALTRYDFRFYNVVASVPAPLCKSSVTLAGRDFAWHTVQELEKLPNWEKNKDVTRHLSDHYDIFFVKAKYFLNDLESEKAQV